jgi:uncharacterized protein YecT (DUF1311 family)
MKRIIGKKPTHRTTTIITIVIALCGLLSTQATAASFDCNKAATWVEKTVCSNPELSKLDDELAKAYKDALASLSPEGQKETKQYQKQWLKKISCIKAKNDKYYDEHKELPASGRDEAIARDLRIAYDVRITQLQQSLIKFPNRIFRNVHVIHLKTDIKCPREIIIKELTYPQIENPRAENEKSWNTYISQKSSDSLKNPTDDEECADYYVEYTINFSNKNLVSVQCRQSVYAHGTPHGYRYIISISRLLENSRELSTSDLFDDKAGWRPKLVALASSKLKEQEVADEETYKIEPSRLMKIVTSPDHWVISKSGLGIQFNEYTLGSRSSPLIIIDWKILEPYLSKNGHSLIFD